MSDTRLRDLEARWKRTGAIDDHAALLRYKVQVGSLDRWRLELASYCRSSVATLALGLQEPVALEPPVDETIRRRPPPPQREVDGSIKTVGGAPRRAPDGAIQVVARPIELNAMESFSVRISTGWRHSEIQRWCNGLVGCARDKAVGVAALLGVCDQAALGIVFPDGVLRAAERWIAKPSRETAMEAITAADTVLQSFSDDDSSFWTQPGVAVMLRDSPAAEIDDGFCTGAILLSAALDDAVYSSVPHLEEDETPPPGIHQPAIDWEALFVSAFPAYRRRIEEWVVSWALTGSVPRVRNSEWIPADTRVRHPRWLEGARSGGNVYLAGGEATGSGGEFVVLEGGQG